MSHIHLLDDASAVRRSLLRRYFPNVLDLLEFYLFFGRLVRVPLLGPTLFKGLLNSYGFHYHGGMALPLEEALRLIDQARSILVSRCPCRTLTGGCGRPLETCLYFDTAADLYEKRGRLGGERIDREQARQVVEASVQVEMMLVFAWCLPPYSYALCSCCGCCCVARRMRFGYGLEAALQPGPFLPQWERAGCTGCGRCQQVCPARAIAPKEDSWALDPVACMGCGLCAAHCPSAALRMAWMPGRIREKPEPGKARKALLWLGAMAVLYPLALAFKGARLGSKR